MNYNTQVYISTFINSNPDDEQGMQDYFKDFAKLYDLIDANIYVTHPDLPENIQPSFDPNYRSILHFEYTEPNASPTRRVIIEDVARAFCNYFNFDLDFQATPSDFPA